MAGGAGTIAIVATGLDLVHPKENIPLQEEILRKGGLILSEQPLGVKANPTRLVARNRLQAALSDEVVVAECPVHSGTMHTVRHAQKYRKTIKAAMFPYNKEENSGNSYIINTGIGIGV
jgi:DNA processing protein